MKKWHEVAKPCTRVALAMLVILALCVNGCIVFHDQHNGYYDQSDEEYFRRQAAIEHQRYEDERARRMEAERNARNQAERNRLERERQAWERQEQARRDHPTGKSQYMEKETPPKTSRGDDNPSKRSR
ncbi:hypothetical protein LJB81_00060 [Desulfovibrio sp. OttesenSCG-928-M14]|nr:hypothetical protein [Desulfovibrio sp. OttesenSCG-928-M14]